MLVCPVLLIWSCGSMAAAGVCRAPPCPAASTSCLPDGTILCRPCNVGAAACRAQWVGASTQLGHHPPPPQVSSAWDPRCISRLSGASRWGLDVAVCKQHWLGLKGAAGAAHAAQPWPTLQLALIKMPMAMQWTSS